MTLINLILLDQTQVNGIINTIGVAYSNLFHPSC